MSTSGSSDLHLAKYGTLLGLIVGLLITTFGLWVSQIQERGTFALSTDGHGSVGGSVLSGSSSNYSLEPNSSEGLESIGEVYARHRIADAQMKTEQFDAAFETIRGLKVPDERDALICIIVNGIRQDSDFETTLAGSTERGADTRLAPEKKFELALKLVDEIANPALKIGFLSRLAELRYEQGDRLADDIETHRALLEKAQAQLQNIQPSASRNSQSLRVWLMGVLGLVTTTITTAGGFVLSNFLKSVLAEWGKKVSAPALLSPKATSGTMEASKSPRPKTEA
jgi:hypothetical protein